MITIKAQVVYQYDIEIGRIMGDTVFLHDGPDSLSGRDKRDIQTILKGQNIVYGRTGSFTSKPHGPKK